MDYTFTYRLGRDDYVALLRANRAMGWLGMRANRAMGWLGRLGWLGRWGRAALFSLFAVAFIASFTYDGYPYNPWMRAVVYLSAFVVLALFASFVMPLIERIVDTLMAPLMVSRYRVTNNDLTLELGGEGIHSKCGGIEGRIPWSAIVRIFATDDHLFLAISRAEMLVIPKRATASAEAFAELTRYVRAKIPAAG
jgi:hypothetical protein